MNEEMSEKNIQKLLTESYRPAEPSAEFEQRVLRMMTREMQALPEAAPPSFHRWLREILAIQADQPRWWVAVAVADIILILTSTALFLHMLPRMAAAPSHLGGIEAKMLEAEPKEGAVAAVVSGEPEVHLEAEEPKHNEASALIDLAANEARFEIRPASIVDIARWVAPAEPAEFDASGRRHAGLFREAPAQRPFDIGSVLGVLASEIKKDLAKDELIAILLLDESRNLGRDRKLIAQEIEKKINDLKKNMPKKRADRLQLALVSFGSKPTLHLGPTEDPAEISKAIQKIQSDSSGKENVIRAVQFTLETIKADDKRKLILLMTDEEGTDTQDDALVDRTLAALKQTEARLYVFGKEGRFQQRLVREWLRDEKGERIGPSEWIPRGIETAREEFFTPDWLFSPYTGRNIPAGFGSFVLSMLARHSGGAYYLLRDAPSQYDEAVLVRYEPEWVTRKEYDVRTSKGRLRRLIREVVEEWSKARPSHWLTELDRIKGEAAEEIAKAERSARLVEQAIANLESSKGRTYGKETPRWEANYDLTLAELCKFRFLLREYVLVLKQCVRDGFPKPGKNQKFNLYHIYCDLKSTATHGGARGAKDFEAAKRALEEVARRYKGTPWGEAAEHERRYLSPLKVKPDFHVEPSKPNKKM